MFFINEAHLAKLLFSFIITLNTSFKSALFVVHIEQMSAAATTLHYIVIKWLAKLQPHPSLYLCC